MSAILLAVRCALSTVFLVAAAGKSADLGGTRQTLAQFAVPVRIVRTVGLALPVTELAVAAMLLIPPLERWGAAVALLLLLIFVVGVARVISHGREPDCHCFGQFASAPVGRSTLIRNLVLATAALLIVAAGPGPTLAGGVRSLDSRQLALLTAAVVIAVLALVAAPVWFDRRRRRRQVGALIATADPPGLPRGTPAPEFSVTSIRGNAVSLGGLMESGCPAVLIFLSTDCAPCAEMLPRLARWQESLEHSVRLPAIFSGERHAIARLSHQHGLSLALAQGDQDLATVYGLAATPSAVLVNPDGAIAGAPATSAPAIEALIRSTLAETRVRPLIVRQS